jgi:hypothetical protein
MAIAKTTSSGAMGRLPAVSQAGPANIYNYTFYIGELQFVEDDLALTVG